MAAWLVQNYSVAHVGYYLAFASVLTLVALVLAPETKTKSLDSDSAQSRAIAEEIVSEP